MRPFSKLRFAFSFILIGLLTSCAGNNGVNLSKGYYKVGKPYTVNGKRYTPEVNYDYSETGLASWYGPGFHGKRTANGEKFNERELTAAHRTLPMPSIVRVTNLDNGKSLVVRVNDRGPFSKNRIIDVSSRAADLLGFKNKGIAKVRVTILEQESKRIADAAKSGVNPQNVDLASMQDAEQKPATLQNAAYQPQKGYNLKTSEQAPITGHLTHGNFYPDLVVTQEKIKPTTIYVQAGAFTSRENAQKLVDKLTPFGQAQIRPALVKGTQYYRVSIPAKTPEAADSLMTQIVRAGHKNTLITIE
jgi:rare lipoprotein A